jgi:hypothetical protein
MAKFVRRNRGLVVAGSVVFVALLVGVAGTTSGWIAAREAGRKANEEAEKTRRAAVRAERALKDLQAANTRLRKTQGEYRRALGELRTELTDKALAATVGGDLNRSETAIAQLELVDAPPGLVRTLRGLALFYSGDVQQATNDLERVAGDEPNSFIALSVLKLAYIFSGRYTSSFVVAKRLRETALSPRDDYEKLFAAQAQLPGSLGDTVDLLDELIEHRPNWALALAVRASKRALLVAETHDLGMAKLALQDIERAKETLTGNPFALTVELHVYCEAIRLGDRKGEDTTAWRIQAERTADELGRFPNYIIGRVYRRLYYRSIGMEELAAAEIAALAKLGWGGPGSRPRANTSRRITAEHWMP